MKPQKICFYCTEAYTSKDNEHIFPEGLGGQRLMMDCVCPECNNKFSPLENELISKSFISFMRVAESPGNAPLARQRTMSEARTLRVDEQLKTALEVRVLNQLKEKLIAQVILKDNLLHIRYEDRSEFDDLLINIVEWKTNNLTVTRKIDDGSIVCWAVAKDDQRKVAVCSAITEARRGYIGLIITSEGDKANELLFPRIFRDGKGRLKIRARSQSEAIELIRHLFWWDSTMRPVIEQVIEGPHEISVLQSHDGVMLNRALVKVAINCLVACYPDSKHEREKLLDALKFARYGAGTVPFVVTHSKTDLDKVEKTHNLFFNNRANDTYVRVSLYNGAFQIIFLLPRLKVLDVKGAGRLLIDYINLRNVFQDFIVLGAELDAIAEGA